MQASRGDVLELSPVDGPGSTGHPNPGGRPSLQAESPKSSSISTAKLRRGTLSPRSNRTLFGAAIESKSGPASRRRGRPSCTPRRRWPRASNVSIARGRSSPKDSEYQADLETAQGNYDVSVADLASAKANVGQNEAALRSSRTNLAYTRIYSPIDGVVITRSIDPGQTVAASFQAPVLFVIAQDLRRMRVLADVDEADVGKLREGTDAEVRVDAFPGERFKGLVSQVRYSPNNQSGVITYSAVVEVDNAEVKLRPGMTATVSVATARVTDGLRVPNAALRFRPSPALDRNGKKAASEPLPALGPNKGRVYVVTDETLGKEKAQLREVDIGITDGVFTVLKTDLGDTKLVIDETDEPSKKSDGRFRARIHDDPRRFDSRTQAQAQAQAPTR